MRSARKHSARSKILIIFLLISLVTTFSIAAAQVSSLDVGRPSDESASDPDPDPNADSDGDGVKNEDDAFPNDFDEQVDTDGDGSGDNKDDDDDGDGVKDEDEITAGTDPLKQDTDGDGHSDYISDDAFPLDPNNWKDSDTDGIGDCDEGRKDDGCTKHGRTEHTDTDDDQGCSNCASGDYDYIDPDSDNDLIPDKTEGAEDLDGDGIPNFRDDDSDGDGISDKLESGLTTWNLENIPVDTDSDETPDYLDLDSDDDGLFDFEEDVSGDGIVDSGETDRTNPDSDGDTVLDFADNCPLIGNEDQADFDNDGKGTICDLEIVLDYYLTENPELETNAFPFDREVIFTIENSTVDGITLLDGAASTIAWKINNRIPTDNKLTLTFADADMGLIDAKITLTDGTREKIKEFQFEINNGLYPVISAPTTGTKITPGQRISFVDASYSLSDPLTSWIVDFGFQSDAWGILILENQFTCYSITDAAKSCTSEIITNTLGDGEPCACESYGATSIYQNSILDISDFTGRTAGFNYDTVNDCGEDYTCSITLTVGTDPDGDGTLDQTASTTLDLMFTDAAICAADPTSELCEENEDLEEDVCEKLPESCNESPKTNLTNTSKGIDTLKPKATGQDSYVSKTPSKKEQYNDPLDNMKLQPPKNDDKDDDKDKGSSGTGTILIVILVISALGGVGFFLWKKGVFGGGKSESTEPSPFTSTPAETKPAETKPVEPAAESSPIKDYIDKAKTAGETEEQMKEGLKAAGWPDSEIDKHL